MMGFIFKEVQKRKFKYYPRYYKDSKQESYNSFAKQYREKKLDQDMELDAQKEGKKFRYKRSLKTDKSNVLNRRLRITFLLLFILMLLIYGIYWILETDVFYEYFQSSWVI